MSPIELGSLEPLLPNGVPAPRQMLGSLSGRKDYIECGSVSRHTVKLDLTVVELDSAERLGESDSRAALFRCVVKIE